MKSINGVKPTDISLKPQGEYIHAFGSFFGKHEMDVVARLIVTLCAAAKRWRGVSILEIHTMGELEGESVDTVLVGWDHLLENGWFTHIGGSRFRVIPDFVKRCKEKSDALLVTQ